MDKLTRRYEIGQALGSGAFSEVRQAVDKNTGQQYAIKIIDKSKCAGKEGMIHSEVNILKKVKHENIISLIELYETETKLYLVMELVTGGELFDSIVEKGHYSEPESARIVYRILSAVNYLHDLGIAHRDLKPENLMFSDKTSNARIMIGDFGLSKIFNEEEVMKTACGTPGYVAPEVLKRKGYSRSVDLWSIGVITYILLVGYPPFYEENNAALFALIMKGDYEFDSPYWDNISKEAKDFISKLLVVDHEKRLDARAAIEHPWIKRFKPEENELVDNLRKLSVNSPESPATDIVGHFETDNNESADSEHEFERQETVVLQNSNPKQTAAERQSTAVNLVEKKPAGDGIRFLSLNLFIRPPLVKTNSSDYKDARLTYFSEHILPNYDIVALQEIYARGSSRQKKLISRAKEIGFSYYLRSPAQDLLKGFIDGGLLILSRYPIIHTTRLTFEKSINTDRFTAKGAIHAHIQISDDLRIHIFNTHLQSSPSVVVDLNDPVVTNRQKQLQELREMMINSVKQFGDSDPIILVGDMNVNSRFSKTIGRHSPEYSQMMNILKYGRITGEATSQDTILQFNDLLYERYNEHPITFGDSGEEGIVAYKDGQKRIAEKTLTEKSAVGCCQSIDYLFLANRSGPALKFETNENILVPTFV
ncbi:Pkinase-domain-containing protein, partial [Rozella allomycis CSF55]